MRYLGNELLLSTTDLPKYVQCEHATFLDRGTRNGSIVPLAFRPPSQLVDVIARKGEEHERAYVDRLRDEGRKVVTIAKSSGSRESLLRADADTLTAMRHGADYIYQAAFFDGRWIGYADLLERVDRPSDLGNHSYEVIDTKLARAVRAHFVLQLCDYSHHLTRLQGVAPEWTHVVLGTNERRSFRVGEFDAYHRHVRGSLEHFVSNGAKTSPYPVDFCALCNWWAHCSKQWNDDGHLSLVANIRRTQVKRLEANGIATLEQLATSPADLTIRKLPKDSLAALQHQARLQLQHRQTGKHTFDLLPREAGRGFARLPRPSPGDVFFDVEGDPFAGDGITFLFGIAWEENGAAEYRAWWAHDLAEERKAFEEVMDFLVARRRDDPHAHIYHYGAMEKAALTRLMGRHGTRENELDDLLRCESFVDLSGVVRQGMRISHASYGLKSVETFYFTRREKGVADAGGAVMAYEQWLDMNDDSMLDDIEAYNREDCVSLIEMQRWLIAIRPDDAGWKEPQQAQELNEDRIAEDQKNDALYRELVRREMPLLAHLLYYHRREERPAWWRWFDRRGKMTDDELVDDSEPIGRLTLDESVAPVTEKKSKIFTYRFPSQEHKFDPGDAVYDRVNRAGEIVSIDDASGTLRLRRGPKLFEVPHPDALIAKPSIDSAPVRDALRRFAESVVASPAKYRAATDILRSAAPRLRGTAELRELLDVAQRLDDSYLFVQGPPGSGKTFNGAHAIVALLRAGKRVGVTSNSHAAIHNLLDAVEKVAAQQGFVFCGLKKGSDARSRFVSKLDPPMIESTDKTEACAEPVIQLVAGTAWLFCDEALDQSLDFLFIDEAGQVSLANALAVATAARNVVLLGDPLQLAQVSQGSHPPGAEVSVLEHLLGEHATVRPDRGLFLEETRRMHPDVCAFVSEVVYESRLRSHDECAKQAVTVNGERESGLRFIAIAHEGNTQSSEEEAAWIAAEIQRMLRGTFTNSAGVTTPLQPSSFLVVAAYNAQVRRITQALAACGLDDVPVGTVDKFQGREAPVVFFSMATSSGAELPRDIEFLFSRNRLNVAISRARCLAVVVASPRLLDVHCKTTDQMKLVNGLCRFVEMAAITRPASSSGPQAPS